MTGPTALERCRMALTEIGHAPTLVRNGSGVPGDRVRVAVSLPNETRWMLLNTAWPDQPVCLPCYLAKQAACSAHPSRAARAAITAAAWEACRACRPFQRESCGATL